MIDISAILTAHSEAVLAGPSLRSFERAIDFARAAGLTVESLIVLDRPDPPTLAQFGEAEHRGHSVVVIEEGDPGMARNVGVRNGRGRFASFHDGDDLWCRNWLANAYEFCKLREDVVAHSEFNIVFGDKRQMWWHVDSEAPGFDVGVLRVANYWDAMSFAARELFRNHPFMKNDLRRGYGHEDWHWNCTTLAAGLCHKPVPGTVHFKRSRAGSQTALCDENDVIPWPSPITPYSWKRTPHRVEFSEGPSHRTGDASTDDQDRLIGAQ